MKKIEKEKQRGVIKYVFYIFILILVLSYFGFNLKEFMNRDLTRENLGYVGGFLFDIWNHYLKPVYDFLADFFGPYISHTLDGLRNHQDVITPNIPDIVPRVNLK